MTDDEMVDEAEAIWNRISHNPELAISVTRMLIGSCLASVLPEDRQIVKHLFFSDKGADTIGTVH